MSEEDRRLLGVEPSVPSGDRLEEHAILNDVIVPIAMGAAGGAASAVVTNLMQGKGGGPSDPLPEPEAPSIELPPGVDRD